MPFIPHTQEELRKRGIADGGVYRIRYLNKDYFNAEESVETAAGTAVVTEKGIFFNVTDPYGMEKLVMQARVTEGDR